MCILLYCMLPASHYTRDYDDMRVRCLTFLLCNTEQRKAQHMDNIHRYIHYTFQFGHSVLHKAVERGWPLTFCRADWLVHNPCKLCWHAIKIITTRCVYSRSRFQVFVRMAEPIFGIMPCEGIAISVVTRWFFVPPFACMWSGKASCQL